MKHIFIAKDFESSALAFQMKMIERKDVVVVSKEKDAHCILGGILEKEDNYIPYLKKGNLFITEDGSSGQEADDLRKAGELVFGGSVASDKLEAERSYGQQIFKQYGLNTAKSFNFKGHEAFNKAKEFVKKSKGRWVIKQNGEAEKAISYVGKFPDGSDIVDRLEDLSHTWTSEIDFDLQVAIPGCECAVEGWFNGSDWIRNKKGEPVIICNIEHKKRSNGDLGRTTGEMGTLAFGIPADSRMASELLKMTAFLKSIKYVGNFDINFMLSAEDNPKYGIKKGLLYALEPTCRFGYPMLNLQQKMFTKTQFSELLHGCAAGRNNFFEYNPNPAVVVVICVPPFPYDSTKDSNNAKGQRIYFLDKGEKKDRDSVSLEKMKSMYWYEVLFEKETKHYLCSGTSGYLLTVAGQADTGVSNWKRAFSQANERALKFIKENVTTSNMDYRTDIGNNDRVEETMVELTRNEYI